MNKIYYLSTCDTCKRILKELEPLKDIELIDIKYTPISVEQLNKMKQLTGTYESLFSKRARLYKERGLKDKVLTETDYKAMLLEHYTFLKRPVIVIGDQIFVGNSAKVVAAAKETLHS